MEINNILQQRRKELGLTQLDVAEAVGVSEATISRWESGDIDNMKRNRIAAYAKVLQISPSVIMGIEDNKDLLPIENVSYLPVIGTVRAGVGGFAETDFLGIEPVIGIVNPDEYRLLLVKGDSMAPAILEDDIAVIHIQTEFENGDIVVAIVDGEEGCIKRINKHEDVLMLESVNTIYPPRIFIKEQMNDVLIFGKVVEIKRKF